MRISEIILDKLNETALFEMSFSRRQVLEKFSNQSYRIAEHLVKILAFDHPNGYNHWASEINAFIKPLWTAKWDGTKRLSKDDIKKCLWKEYLENGEVDIQGIIDNIRNIDNYGAPRNELSLNEINQRLLSIYDQLSEKLSNGKPTPIQTIIQSDAPQ